MARPSIVCPTSLVTNWENEARKFTPELKTLVLEGADRAALFNSIEDVDMVITSYALLRRDIETLREISFSTAVLDEAQHIKNPETQNAQAAYALRAQASLRADRHADGKFRARSLVDHELRAARLSRGSQGFPRALRTADRARLRARSATPALAPAPAVPAPPAETRRRERFAGENRAGRALQPNEPSTRRLRRAPARNPAGSRQFRQECERRRATDEDADRPAPFAPGLLRSAPVGIDKEETSAKLELLDELLEEAIDGEHRVLVFSQFVSMLHLIRERLEKLEIPFCYLDGSTKQRQEIVDRFQSDAAIPVFLISLKAGGVGLNLSAADTVIHFDPWWNPAVEAQATDRAHRIGQTRVVTAYKLITRDTVEEKILQAAGEKRAAIDAAIDSEEPLMTGLTTEELEELLA